MPKTPTEALVDVNVLVATVFSDHSFHDRARIFVEQLEQIYTSPTIQGGFLRFATRPWKDAQKREQPPRLTMVEAQETLRKFLLTPGHVFLADDASYVDVPSKSLQGHRQWTDAYLLSLARKHNLMLASLDSRLSNVDDAANPAFFLLV